MYSGSLQFKLQVMMRGGSAHSKENDNECSQSALNPMNNYDCGKISDVRIVPSFGFQRSRLTKMR